MKYRIVSILLVLLLVTALFPTFLLTASALSGNGTRNDPYLIGSTEDWIAFVDCVNDRNEEYGDKFYLLTQDITVNTSDEQDYQHIYLVGEPGAEFRGHFDGGNHTLTFNCSRRFAGAAPFSYVIGAYIENLTVSGTIKAVRDHAAGIIGCVSGDANTQIRNCTSSVTIQIPDSHTRYHGGFVGWIDTGSFVQITDGVFNGSFVGSQSNYDSGFIGLNSGGAAITECLCDPVSVSSVTRFCPFMYDSASGRHMLYNAYRTTEEDPWFDESCEGLQIYENAPADRITSKITIFTGDLYWRAGAYDLICPETVEKYAHETAEISYSLTFDGATLTEGTDFDAVLTDNGGNAVSNTVEDAGVYTLTAVCKGDYAGTVSKTVTVTDIVVPAFPEYAYLDENGVSREPVQATAITADTTEMNAAGTSCRRTSRSAAVCR